MAPAPGQGALMLEARADDARTIELTGGISDAASARALQAERTMASPYGATCHTRSARTPAPSGECLKLDAFVGASDGSLHARVREEDRATTPACSPRPCSVCSAESTGMRSMRPSAPRGLRRRRRRRLEWSQGHVAPASARTLTYAGVLGPGTAAMSASSEASVPRGSTITGQRASAVTRRETPPSSTARSGP
jgi:hypothetical protein